MNINIAFIGGIVVGILLLGILTIGNITTTNANIIDVPVSGNVQQFDYQGVTCLTWKSGYGGGISCLPSSDFKN